MGDHQQINAVIALIVQLLTYLVILMLSKFIQTCLITNKPFPLNLTTIY